MAREKKRFPFSSLSEKNWDGGFSWLLLFARYRLVSKAADRRRRFSRRCKGTTFFQNSKANTEKRVNKNFPIFFEDWKVFEHSNTKYKYNRNPQEASERGSGVRTTAPMMQTQTCNHLRALAPRHRCARHFLLI